MLARLAVFDKGDEDDTPAQAFLSGLEGEPLEAATRIFLDASGGLTAYEAMGDGPDDDVTGLVPEEQAGLFQNFYFPAGMRGAGRRRDWHCEMQGKRCRRARPPRVRTTGAR
jgi:hypothetical protein